MYNNNKKMSQIEMDAEVDSEIKKKINSFTCSNGNSLFIQPNPKIDYVFSDSFTISFDIFVDDDQSEDGCIVGKEGYDSGVFIKKVSINFIIISGVSSLVLYALILSGKEVLKPNLHIFCIC